jgi:hypothetical protein
MHASGNVLSADHNSIVWKLGLPGYFKCTLCGSKQSAKNVPQHKARCQHHDYIDNWMQSMRLEEDFCCPLSYFLDSFTIPPAQDQQGPQLLLDVLCNVFQDMGHHPHRHIIWSHHNTESIYLQLDASCENSTPMDQDSEEVQDIAHCLKAILHNPDAADDDNNKDVVEMDNAPSSDNELESTSEHPLLCMLLPLTYKQSLYHINEPTSAKQQVHQVGQL